MPDKLKFYSSAADSLQSLLMAPLFLYTAWSSYSRNKIVLAALFVLAAVVLVYAVLRQMKKPLFAFDEESLLVRDSFGANFNVSLAEITGIDDSAWIGIKILVNFNPQRLFVNRLSREDKRAFLALLRERTGLD